MTRIIRIYALAAIVILAPAMLVVSRPVASWAQMPGAMKDDIEQLAFDLHMGVKRGNLTSQQKAQLRQDLSKLRQARATHDRIAAFMAIRNFHQILDSGAFRPQDQARIQQDLKQLREARQQGGGL